MASSDVLSGTFAGRYTIERELGSGATATVYLARDTQRGISVAVKLLRPELAQSVGADRFLREIRLNEKLHHPHIVPVLDSGEHDGRLYFVLPHMEEGSLRQMLQREKQLPIETAISIARTIAQALDYAHQQNLIHRDVKPENILFTSGQACLADFGIARAVERAMDESTTDTGMVRGTPAYMSPEQASGSRQYDGRSDQYSLACVLYEMLAGVPAFIGPTPEAVIAQRFQHAPRELRVYRPTAPAAIEEVIHRALSIAPADRFAAAADFASALDMASHTSTERTGPAGDGVPTKRDPWKRSLLVAAATGGLALITALAMTLRNGPEVVTFVVPPPTGAVFSDDMRDVSAVSPDGREILFAGTDSQGVRHLWLRRLSDPTATKIRGTEFGTKAFWSPDGRAIALFQRRNLVVIDRAGGTARRLATSIAGARGGSWADNGTILFAPGPQSGIFVTSLSDSTTRQITAPSAERGEIGHMWPYALPGGREFLYFVASAVDSVRGIYLASTTAPRGRRVVGSSASAVFSNGHMLFVEDGALVAQRLDVASASLVGSRRRIADSVATSFEYYGAFSASDGGVLVYAAGRARDISRLAWMDTSGAHLGFASGPGYLRNPNLSRDGRHLAFETYRETDSDVRSVNLITGATAILPDGGTQALDPVWSPDGTTIAFVSERPGGWGLFRKRMDRADAPELLLRSVPYAVLTDWSPDGNSFILAEATPPGDWDLVARRLGALDHPVVLAGGAGHQVGGRISPDGRHLAYVSTETGTSQVFVHALPTGTRCQISVSGGHQPVWGAEPGTLFYLSPVGTMMHARLDVRRAAPCPLRAPRALFETQIHNPGSARSFFDVSLRDGRFLVNAPAARDSRWLNVIINWQALAAAAP